MKILITGGAGFIGSHLTEQLLAQGEQVLVIDNYATGQRDNLTSHDNLTLVEGTIADSDLVNQTFDNFQPEIVVHAAASYKDPENWAEDSRTNVLGSANVVQASQKVRVKRLIYLQTALCYGKPQEHPITLSHPIAPFSSYAISKTAGEKYVILSGLSYVSLRLANLYGPRHFSGPMPTFYKRLKAKKPCFVVDTRRDFLELEDFLDLIRIVMKSSKQGCYHVSSGQDCTIKEIFDLMVERMNISLEQPVEIQQPYEDNVATLLLDPSETEKTFGWKARIPLRAGIDRIIKWYDAHGVGDSYTHLRDAKKD